MVCHIATLYVAPYHHSLSVKQHVIALLIISAACLVMAQGPTTRCTESCWPGSGAVELFHLTTPGAADAVPKRGTYSQLGNMNEALTFSTNVNECSKSRQTGLQDKHKVWCRQLLLQLF